MTNRYGLFSSSAAALAMLITGGVHPEAGTALAADEHAAWDVTSPRGNPRTVAFATDEGTFMSADAIPAGRGILFDHMGHIYHLPLEGGAARSLTATSGLAINMHPSVSPDGKRVAFASDRGGYMNLWVMDIDGKNARLMIEEPQIRVSQPAWAPDGNSIVAVRSKNTNYWISEGIWRYPAEGGAPERLVEGEVGHPAFAPDGASLYYHRMTARDLKAIDFLVGHYQIERIDLATGETAQVSFGMGGIAPEPSPDGRYLAYARKVPDGTVSYKGHVYGPRMSLWTLDLETGEGKLVADPIENDVAETGGDLLQPSRLLPGYSWSDDSRSIIVSRGGRLNRVDVEDGASTVVPMTVNVRRELSEMAMPRVELSGSDVHSRFVRWPTASPDGNWVVHEAFGRLWIEPRSGGEARQLTPRGFAPLAFMPSWSPDGSRIAFVTWEDGEGGHIWTIPARGGTPTRVTSEAGEYLHPVWQPDGSAIIASAGQKQSRRGARFSDIAAFTLTRFPLKGAPEPILPVERVARTREVVRATFGPAGRLYYTQDRPTANGPITELRSIALDGGAPETHLTVPFAGVIVPSPDGLHAVVEKSSDLYLVPLERAAAGELTDLYSEPVRQLTETGGLYPRWRSNSEIEFGSADRHAQIDISDDTRTETTLDANLPRYRGTGTIAFTNARLVTLEAEGVIENGTLVISGDSIACVGSCTTGAADRVVDLSGHTIVPGFVDTHGSGGAFYDVILPRKHYQLAVDLAYGVTTTYSPSQWSQFVYPMAELIETGGAIGPRIFTGADKLRWDPGPFYVEINDLDDARSDLRKIASWGGVLVKQYLRENHRAERQQVAVAAREQGLGVTAHLQKGFLEYGLSLALDGYTATQHLPVQMPLYSDYTRFFGEAGFTHNMTLSVGGGIFNEAIFFQGEDFWMEDKQRRFIPYDELAALRRRTIRPETDYMMTLQAQAMADIVDAGGYAAIGSHGQHPGLSPHFEIWGLATAMEPVEALRSASLHGARVLGVDDEIGSLKVGKRADLVVLEKNPLDDIRNTMSITHVMKDGVLRDGDTLDEVWPNEVPFGDLPWGVRPMLATGAVPLQAEPQRD